MNGPNIWSDLVALAVAIVLGLAMGLRMGRRGAYTRGRLSWNVLAVLLIGPALVVCTLVFFWALMRSATVEWYMPALVDFYAVPGLWSIFLAGLFFSMAGISGIVIRTKPEAQSASLVLLLFYIFIIEYGAHLAPWFEPADIRAPRVSEEGIILQSSGSTCAAAVCANLARLQGFQISEAEMAGILGTTRSGTRTAQMIYGLRTLGIHLRKRYVPLDQLDDLTLPAIAFTGGSLNPDSHTVLIVAVDNDMVEIWDPLKGKRLQPLSTLAPLWSGHVLELEKSP